MKANMYKNEFRLLVFETFKTITQFKKKNDRESFNKSVLKIMPEMKKYINGRLNTAIKKGHFSKGKYKADDIIDQLFIDIYDTIDDIDNENKFHLWLFKKTNELLDDIIIEEEFDDFFYKNIDDYSQPEWDEMQEMFSTDADGDLMMIEELDDLSYNHNNYTLNHVFIEDNEKALIEKLDRSLDEEKIQNHIAMVLQNLPSKMRNVFELYANHYLTLEEIAQIRDITLDEAKHLLNDAKKSLQISLFNRYPLE